MAPTGFRSDRLLRRDRDFDSYGDQFADVDFDAAGSGWIVADCAAGEDLWQHLAFERTGECSGGCCGGAGR
jgi:hypothetical protein